ncbi:hypothetical protein ACWDE0_03705, partial [Streptomyces sp. 900105755]
AERGAGVPGCAVCRLGRRRGWSRSSPRPFGALRAGALQGGRAERGAGVPGCAVCRLGRRRGWSRSSPRPFGAL